jgi:hypothetical protein
VERLAGFLEPSGVFRRYGEGFFLNLLNPWNLQAWEGSIQHRWLETRKPVVVGSPTSGAAVREDGRTL